MEENKIIIYQTEDGQTQIDVRLENDTVWLSANQMAVLFGRDEKTVRKHINNVFSDQEVPQDINTHFLRVNGVTFGGEELYPSVEEKAAMLLYLVTKNHSFSDGNKRIAATLFLWFLNNNGILYRQDGSKRIADNTLVALTLMIAESKTEEKDVMVKVVVNLINQRNN
jgi:prophage maintenance system killer protein